MTSSNPYQHFSHGDRSVLNPPVETNNENEDQTQDPTWKPRVQLETRTTDDRIEARHGYWLRDRSLDMQAAPSDDVSEVVEKQIDNAARGTEPLESPIVEAGQEQIRDEGNDSTPRYNLRPLPGRKLTNP
jgi:hypothetical protein